jgi:hypothetical protein
MCPSGRFAVDVNSAGCIECPFGYFQLDEGKVYCQEVKAGFALAAVSGQASAGEEASVVYEEVRCPLIGMECKGNRHIYAGGYWHNPKILIPTESTEIYVCPSAGCPKAGDTVMQCAEGYKQDSPLCAVCDDGYQKQLRECTLCKAPRWGQLCLLLSIATLFAAVLFRTVWVYRDLLESMDVFAHAKILISFITLAVTVCN